MPKDMDELITITMGEYEQFLEARQFLDALQAAGVDNWDGYDIAHDLVKEWNKEENGDD